MPYRFNEDNLYGHMGIYLKEKTPINDIRCFWICKGNNAVNYLIRTYTRQIDIIIEVESPV
jgi:hypothetical protein